jgi:carbon-monoxide dehydrogenase iron sulfur subunit
VADRVITIDYDKCTGCLICETVCSARNCGEINPAKSRIRVIRLKTEGIAISIPILCMKCMEAPCKSICPVGAISDDPVTGARVVNENKCIACSACVYACPFGAITVDRALGHAFNCNLCDGEPICVQFCPRDAIRYLDSDEVGIQLRRSHLDNYMAFFRGATLTGE